jgi:hypothetical protein
MRFAPTYKKSVMFSAHFEDGRIGYFVVMGHSGPERDFLALSAARERQLIGELPEGAIRALKRIH